MSQFIEIGSKWGFKWLTLALAALAVGVACATNPGPGTSPPMTVVDFPGMQGAPRADRLITRRYIYSLGWADDDLNAWVQYRYSWGNNQNALIRIVPARRGHEQTWQPLVPNPTTEGHFVAKIYNLENVAVPPLGLAATDDVVYLWVGQLDGGGRGAAFYTVRGNGLAVVRRSVPIVGFCEGQHPYARVRVTDGDECATRRRSMAHLIAHNTTAGTFADAGIWLACKGGCCEVKPE